ncbi:hypothetical protein J2S10_001359 [Neobacillus ginsengisoli]|uniref:Uncharacterized protein n=1 Tax=Neobacillus ginsengisoli TaxID=904295 RepID=A0ABT9XRQ4_9BACI|nr:hypothetical protein [Neobacillus ginsengisoli]
MKINQSNSLLGIIANFQNIIQEKDFLQFFSTKKAFLKHVLSQAASESMYDFH